MNKKTETVLQKFTAKEARKLVDSIKNNIIDTAVYNTTNEIQLNRASKGFNSIEVTYSVIEKIYLDEIIEELKELGYRVKHQYDGTDIDIAVWW